MDLDPDSLRVSTWPRRTTVENSSPSRTTHSAAVAPPFMARLTTSVATSFRSVAGFVSVVSCVVVIFEIRIYHGGAEAQRKTNLFFSLLLYGCGSALLW